MPSFILSCLHHAGRRCALQLVHRTASGPFLSLVNPWGHATHPAAATTASRNHHVRILRLCPMHLPQSKHGVRTYTHAYMYSSTHTCTFPGHLSWSMLPLHHHWDTNIYTHIHVFSHTYVYLPRSSILELAPSAPALLSLQLVTSLGPAHCGRAWSQILVQVTFELWPCLNVSSPLPD